MLSPPETNKIQLELRMRYTVNFTKQLRWCKAGRISINAKVSSESFVLIFEGFDIQANPIKIKAFWKMVQPSAVILTFIRHC